MEIQNSLPMLPPHSLSFTPLSLTHFSLFSSFSYWVRKGLQNPVQPYLCLYFTYLKLAIQTWIPIWARKINLSLSKRPRLVYTKTEKVMQSIRLFNLSIKTSEGLALMRAFWNTTLKAYANKKYKCVICYILYNITMTIT